VRRRAVALLAALGVAVVLAACGSNDNGGVIQPTGTTVPGATTTAGGGTPGY